MYVDELFVVVCVLSHVRNDSTANVGVVVLGTIELIGKTVEEAVAISASLVCDQLVRLLVVVGPQTWLT